MAELALFLSFLSVVILTVESSSSTYHRIQVGGPANQITTGEIRIDLPAESFQNLKFNITPYSLQQEYSPYYDQYTTGYKPSSFTPNNQQTYKTKPAPIDSYKPAPVVSYKPAPVVSYKPAPVVSYKPAPVVSYKPAPIVSYKPAPIKSYTPAPIVPYKAAPSITHPYTYTQPQLNQVTYTQPKITYSEPSYQQPKVIFGQPAYNQVKVSFTKVKAPESKATTTTTIPPKTEPTSSPPSPIVITTKPPKPAAEEPAALGYYGAYPYPYQQNRETVKAVVDLKVTEEDSEAAPVKEAQEEVRTSGEADEKSRSDYRTVFTQFNSFNSDDVKDVKEETIIDNGDVEKEESKEEEETREAKAFDTDADTSNLNTLDSAASTTLLPEFVPIIEEEGVVSPVTKVTPVTTTVTAASVSSTISSVTRRPVTSSSVTRRPVTSSSVTRSPVTSFIHESVTATGSTSAVRRRPVTSVFHDSGENTSDTHTTSTTTTTAKPTTMTTTTDAITTAATTTATELVSLGTTSSKIRRRPVVSFFRDVTTSTPATPPRVLTNNVTPPGQIGQTILDKMRAATLTVQTILESEEDKITLEPDLDENDNGETIETDEKEEGDEEISRERRKVVKVRKPKPGLTFDWPSIKGF